MAVQVEEALKIIIDNIEKNDYEIVPIEHAQNRICAQDIKATHNLPKFDNSAMDGYAILEEDIGKVLKVTDKIFAGDNNQNSLKEGECTKIMTGARVPQNTGAIVPQEDVENIDENRIKLSDSIKPMQHIRFIGEDVKEGEELIQSGETINFAKITLLASQGISHLKVFKRPKVVVFASGEELKLHYENAQEYQIYNSNTPTFIARAKELGCEISFIGQAHDSIDSIKEHIQNALDADLIITSGGVSVGEADFTKAAFNALGFEALFEGIIIKPGKPTVFGKIGKTFILNLPGNPLASALIFEMFGKIIVQKLIGSNAVYHNAISTPIQEDLFNKKGRITIVPGFFDGEGFIPSKKRSPGMVSVLSQCNAMLVLDENVEKITQGSLVKVLPIDWKFFSREQKDYLTYE